jgi:hypothetical protein
VSEPEGRWTARFMLFLRIMAGSETTDETQPGIAVPET